jgi:hypothetical protein
MPALGMLFGWILLGEHVHAPDLLGDGAAPFSVQNVRGREFYEVVAQSQKQINTVAPFPA